MCVHVTRLPKENLFFPMFAPALGRESLAPLPFEGGFKQAYLGKNFVVQPSFSGEVFSMF